MECIIEVIEGMNTNNVTKTETNYNDLPYVINRLLLENSPNINNHVATKCEIVLNEYIMEDTKVIRILFTDNDNNEVYRINALIKGKEETDMTV